MAPVMDEKYDVFLSFRGEDTRNTFTSHLHAALLGKKVETYIDYRIERGDKIAPALLEAIEKSKLSVIIFSKNYASSTWCLDELVHILKCKERDGQFVIPIFYDINPSHVRKQQGSFADAFAQHEERFKDNMDKVHKWRLALRKAAKISGFDDSNKIGLESDLVKKVVKDILTKLNRKTSSDLKGLVGIESRIEEIESLLCIDSQDVCSVGVWGMGGIGKTTLADAIFHQISSKFEASCFLANVRVKSEEKDGLIHLRNTLVRKILDDENLNIDTPSIGSDLVRKRLGRTKVLIVLDDVDDSSQIELLAGDHARFGPGSRIIITTRDRSLLKKTVEDDKIYKVKALTRDEALQLFHLNAFKNNTPRVDYTELAQKVVGYAGGIPLAVQILGSSFIQCERKEDWPDELINLKKFLSKKIQKVLRLNFDGLEENEKEIFLDIACFDEVQTLYIVKRIGIRVLSDKSLISVSENMTIEMHDLLQDMGKEIVREQCIEEPGKRSRLFMAEDVYRVLKNNTGTATVQAIFMNMSEIGPLHSNRAYFKRMYNLRLLNVDNSSFGNYWELDVSLPNSLRYLCWVGYQLESLPSEFSPENLVELRMSYSNVELLWNEDQNPGNLKVLDLSYSRNLTEVPDFSQSHKLEYINLEGCTSLVQIPSYCQYLDKLTYLNLGGCLNLESLPEMPGNIEYLDMSSTAIKEMPSSVWSNEKISCLDIQWCKDLKNLPSNSCKLKLCNLSFQGCSSLGKFSELPSNIMELELSETAIKVLPSSIENLSCLKKIVLQNCGRFVSLPTSFCKLNSLERLDFTGCFKFEYFPEILEPMEHLNFLSLSQTAVKELPSSIDNLMGLQTLQLYGCKNLKFVPNSIYNLDSLKTLMFGGCLKLKSLPFFSVGLCSLEELNLSYCGILEISDSLICLTSLRDIDLSGTMIRSLPASIPKVEEDTKIERDRDEYGASGSDDIFGTLCVREWKWKDRKNDMVNYVLRQLKRKKERAKEFFGALGSTSHSLREEEGFSHTLSRCYEGSHLRLIYKSRTFSTRLVSMIFHTTRNT
ncbi:Putative disease resistance TIR-NBS-LRR class protein [Prunus dulcis]|uniref:Disease resistance TIR-NBS-LRR class protein n=1 Tax=Prunus dulcis TaxID=3755 RepID=A0A4Y1RMA9_PRUDU|nr:Putative disease resistance TIR-NBS-LRR class protein [Prunus dulcis]